MINMSAWAERMAVRIEHHPDMLLRLMFCLSRFV
jgi:hypothetical protein